MAIPKPNIATAAKAKTTSGVVNAKVLAAAAKESPLINPNQVQNQGTDGSSQSNKPRPGFEGPPPNVPEVNRPGDYTPATAESQQATLNNALGLVSKTDAMKQLAGVGTSSTAAQSEKDKLTDLSRSSTTEMPAFDQGFSSQPSNLDANTVPGGDPMAAFQGQGIGGVLGAAAASSQPTPPPASSGAAGSGMVSAEPAPAPAAPAPEPTFAEWLRKGFYALLKTQPENGTINDEAAKQLDQIKPQPDPTPGQAGGGTKMPNPENTGSSKVNILSQTLLDQLNAAKAGKPASQGGSGDATPVDNGGIPQVVRNGSIAVNQGAINGRNLFGQPGGSAIGENVSGGNKGLGGFTNSNGAGAINPGPDGGNPSGDSRFQQDPAAAMGTNQPAPEFPSAVGSQESQSSSVTTTLAAGARNLTLTGTALINGTGNVLDNLINGNSAANELRGEAGNDSLDGKAGNDLLDGGAGRDQLTGGSGADRFRFATAGAFGTAQADRITDFSRSEGDRIELSRSAFGLSAGAAVSFQSVNNDAELTRALGCSTLLVQDLRDGSILFNQNGSTAGVGQGGVFAVVSQGLTLQASDFALGA
jgi:hypothetical protein